jgi:6-phosphogluconate dehydrogenase
MKRGLGMKNKQIGDVLATWNKGVLDSFLIEITRDIMYFNDDDGTPLVEKILDKAGQKGTGKWTAVNALDLGMPVTLIAEAVLSRCLSAIKDERTKASGKLEFVGRSSTFEGNQDQFLDDLEQGLYASKIISYAQGFMLMQEVCFLPRNHNDQRICMLITFLNRPPRSMAGNSTSQRLHSCGVVVASSAQSS